MGKRIGSKMTIAEAKKIVRNYDCTLKKNVFGEFELRESGRKNAYYTDDLMDVIGTAEAMYRRTCKRLGV